MIRDRVALLTLLVLLFIVSLPYMLAVALAPVGKEFLGSFYNSQDTSVYLSAMRAGARGEWLRTLPFTSEPHAPALYYPFYLLLGHIAAPDLITFHVARLAVVVFLAWALWQLVAEILPTRTERRVAFTLALLGMGFGWVVTLGGLGKIIRSTDIFAPTASLLGAAMLNPHFPLGAALQFVTMTQYVRARREPYRTGTLLVGALACLAMSWILPYQLVVVAAIFFVAVMAESIRQRQVWTCAARAAFCILLPSSTVVIYYFALSHFMPFWSELIAQWPVLEHQFAPLDFAMGYGWLLMLALIGAVALWRQSQRSDGERLLIVWLVVNTLLIIAPLDFSDRTSLGFSAVLAMLSAIAIARAIPAWRWPPPIRHWFTTRYPHLSLTFPSILVLSVIPSALLLALSLPLLALADGDLPFYIGKDDAAIIDWLKPHAQSSDIVLAPPAISNLIPALSDARVYSGHTHETFQATRKNAEVEQFFNANESEIARSRFLREHRITFVYARPPLGGANDQLEPVIRGNRSALYKVILYGH